MADANLTLNEIEAISDKTQKTLARLQHARRMAKNMSTMATTLNESRAAFTNVQAAALMQSAFMAVPFYSGTTPLRTWMQDVENYEQRIDDPTLRDTLRGKTMTVSRLILSE